MQLLGVLGVGTIGGRILKRCRATRGLPWTYGVQSCFDGVLQGG